jgi:mRNA-degrading endonuclease RelE of RelBE toxin-antitoxin system
MARSIRWSDEARVDIRALDRRTAMRIFDGLQRYTLTGEGDVRVLEGKYAGQLRLRLGDYRVFFALSGNMLRVLKVKHRREAYR